MQEAARSPKFVASTNMATIECGYDGTTEILPQSLGAP